MDNKLNYWIIPAMNREKETPVFMLKSELRDGSRMSDPKRRFLDRLRVYVELEYDIIDLFDVNRQVDYIKARSTFIHLTRKYTSIGYVALGRYMSKDHSTMIHNHKVACNWLELCPDYEMSYVNIDCKVKALLVTG